MTENELLQAVIDLAHAYHWRVAHFRGAWTGRGYKTPVAGDGKGFPDLLMVRELRMIVAELKAEKKKPEPEQRAWLDAFSRVMCAEVHVWTPAQWFDRSIVAALR